MIYVDPSGHKHIVSSYTFIYKYEKVYGYGVKGDGYRLEPVYVTVNKHEFTNINLTVYENYDTSIDSELNDNWRHYNLDPIKAYNGEMQAFIENGTKYEKGSIADLTLLDMDHKYDIAWNWIKVGVSAVSDIASVAKAAKILKNADKAPNLLGKVWNFFVDAFTPGVDDLGTGIGDAAMGQLPKDKQETIEWLAGLIPIYGTYQAITDATSNDPIKGVFVNYK